MRGKLRRRIRERKKITRKGEKSRRGIREEEMKEEENEEQEEEEKEYMKGKGEGGGGSEKETRRGI